MNQKRRAATRMSLVAFAASSALFLGACGGGENAPSGHQAAPAPAPAQSGPANPGAASVSSCVPTDQVLNNAQSYAGKQVTITGTVAQVVGQHVFTVAPTGNNSNGSNAQAGRTQTLLAVAKETMPLAPGGPVQITGTLQPTFDRAQAATFAGGSLGQDPYTSFNGKPYVQAEFAGPISANLIRGGQAGSIVSGGDRGSCAAVSDVLNSAPSYASKQVTITGTIAQIVDPHVIAVAPTGNNNGNNAQTLLALDKETMPFTPGAPVEVTGTLQPAFDTNQAAVFTGSNMENLAAFTPFNGKPYVQATFVGPASANLPGGQNGS
jgi:hypothetical protein